MTWSRQRFVVICAVLFGVLLAGCAPAATEEPPPVDPQVVTVAPTAGLPTAATVAPGLPQLDAGTAIPTPTVTPSPTATPLIKGVYEVTPGDTLIDIAIRYDVTVEELIRVNGLTNPNLLAVGQELRIPGGAEEPPPDLGPTMTTIMSQQWLHNVATTHQATLNASTAITVVHEIGHYLGLDEDDLAERGID